MAPEVLFHPELINWDAEDEGLHKMIEASIKKCDYDIIQDLYSNIVLSGGNTLFEGIGDRLEKELPAKVIASKDRYNSVWIGGSILTSLSTFESQWITKEEYEENGAEIVLRKCVE